jgi:murein endopeptidase
MASLAVMIVKPARLALAATALAALACAAAAADAAPIDSRQVPPVLQPPAGTLQPIVWRQSRALGRPWAGRLVDGVQLPAEGVDFFTWDFPLKSVPNRDWRRWGTDKLVRTVLTVLSEYRLAHPDAERVGVADLSREHGGSFGREFGGLGHASHQNGLDADILYPRLDGLARPPLRSDQIDTELAQDLVDRFVLAGARYIFIGDDTGLRPARRVVQVIPHHNDHFHVRVWPAG